MLSFFKRHSGLFEIYYCTEIVLTNSKEEIETKFYQNENHFSSTAPHLLRAPTCIKPDEFYAPSTASMSLSRIHLYHLISTARRQKDHSGRQLDSRSVTNKK